MMKRTVLAIVLSAAALSAQASDINYNYVQGTYGEVDLEGADLDGFGIDGSIKFNDSFYGIAGYEKYDDNGVDLSEITAGVGFIKSVSDKTDWVSELSFVRNKTDFGFGSFSDNGYRVATGLRGMVSDKFELNGKVSYTDVGDFGNGFGASVGAVYHVNDTFGITAGYDYADRDNADLDGWNVGARISF